MARMIACVVLAVTLLGIQPPLMAAAQAKRSQSAESARIAAAASTLATITGIAISPLLGTGVYGCYKYISTEESERGGLPWFAKPEFFIPALIIAGICAAKDTFGVVFPPGMKKPLDVLELLENKFSGLIAAGAVVPITIDTLTKVLMGNAPHASSAIALPHGLATITVGAIDWSWAMNIITVPVGIIVFAVVWMASHAINVLIVLSPWAAIDAALKAARMALLAAIAGMAQWDPKSAAFLCLLIIIAAYFISGWAFRLTTFGTIFTWDFLTLRRRRFVLSSDSNRIFSSGVLKEQRKVPARTYGQLIRNTDGRLVFRYRPWLLLKTREVDVPKSSSVAVGRGVFFSVVLADEKSLFLLPPRYYGHENQLAEVYGFSGVRDVGLRRAWGWLKEAIAGRPSLTTAEPTV